MKHILFSALVIIMISVMPVIALAQKDTTSEKMFQQSTPQVLKKGYTYKKCNGHDS